MRQIKFIHTCIRYCTSITKLNQPSEIGDSGLEVDGQFIVNEVNSSLIEDVVHAEPPLVAANASKAVVSEGQDVLTHKCLPIVVVGPLDNSFQSILVVRWHFSIWGWQKPKPKQQAISSKASWDLIKYTCI